MKTQKKRQSFSRFGLFSGLSAGFDPDFAVRTFPSLSAGTKRAAISPKHLIASMREVFGTRKLLSIRGINSVSKMYSKGIQVKKVWKVRRQALTREGLII
jgi:hypothetical protein